MLTNRQLRRLARQDERLLPVVIDAYGPWVKAICYRIVAPIAGTSAVEECVNDVFLRIWTKAPTFDGTPEQFKGWVGQVTKSVAIDHYRKVQRQLEREALYADIPETPVEEKDDSFHEQIATLSTIDQQIFKMKYESGYSSKEIAEQLHLTVASVDNRLSRGRRQLAVTLHPKRRDDDATPTF